MKAKKLVLSFIIVAILQASMVLADDWGDVPGTDLNILKVIFGPEVFTVFPDNDPTSYGIFQYLIFPFLALWMVIYGILEEIRIFRRQSRLQGVIAFLISMIAGPTGGLVALVRGSFIILGGFGFLTFVILMFVGIFMWGAVRLWEYGNPFTSGGRNRAKKTFMIERELGELRDTYQTLMLAGKYNEAEKVLKEWSNRMKELRDERTK